MRSVILVRSRDVLTVVGTYLGKPGTLRKFQMLRYWYRRVACSSLHSVISWILGISYHSQVTCIQARVPENCITKRDVTSIHRLWVLPYMLCKSSAHCAREVSQKSACMLGWSAATGQGWMFGRRLKIT